MADPDLSPFILADKGLIANSLVELEQGRKRSHWMWFIFPQLAGRSTNPSMMSQRYAIRDLRHARALLEHPVLARAPPGAYRRQCCVTLRRAQRPSLTSPTASNFTHA